jgi:hypothetical protein
MVVVLQTFGAFACVECLRSIYLHSYRYTVYTTVSGLKRLNFEILNREVTPNGRAVRIAPLFCITGMIEATISQQQQLLHTPTSTS